MLGSNAGGVIGSVRESLGKKHKDFPLFVPGCRFTDDLLQTSTGAEWLLHGGDSTMALHDSFHAETVARSAVLSALSDARQSGLIQTPRDL